MVRLTALALLLMPVAGVITHAAPEPAATAASNRSIVTQQVYGPDPEDTMTSYAPPVAGRFPAVVFVHGGAWGRSQPNVYELRFARTLAEDHRWVVAVIGYPTWVKDERRIEPASVRRAVESVSARRDVAPGRIALWGESAGGHLALLTAYRDARRHHPLVSAVVSISGPTDMGLEFDSLAQTTLAAVTRFEGLAPAAAQRVGSSRYRSTSPVHLVRPDCPPTFQAISRHDPLVPPVQVHELTEALRDREVRHQTAYVAGSDHSSPIESERPPGGRATVEQLAIGFIRQAFGRVSGRNQPRR